MAMEPKTELDEPLGTRFDAEASAEHDRELKALKKNNLQNVFGQGAGRFALIVIALLFIAMLAFGAMKIFKKPAPQQAADTSADAGGAVRDVPPIEADSIASSDKDAAQRRQTVAAKAQEAAAKGEGYIAPPVLRGAGDDDGLGEAKPAVSTAVQQGTPIPVQPLPEAENPAAIVRAQRIAALQPVRDKILAEQALPQILVALGRERDGKQVLPFTTQVYALPDRTKTESVSTVTAAASVQTLAAATTAAAAQKGKQIISAGDGYYCEMDYGINSDAPRKDVFATCAQGVLAGAKLIGKYEEPREGAGATGVSALFSILSFPGRPAMAVQAVAIDDSNGETYLADDVNHHSVIKYGGLFAASLLRGIGRAASVITGSTTTVSNGAQSTTITSTDPITAQRQLKIAAGEVGTTFSEVLQRNSENLKTTIRVNEKKGIRVVFLADVFEEKK